MSYQEITKQDTSLSILKIFTGLMIIYSLYIIYSFESEDIIHYHFFLCLLYHQGKWCNYLLSFIELFLPL